MRNHPNRTQTYHLYIPRRYAVLFLAWEVGVKNVRRNLARLSRDERGWIDMADMTIRRPIEHTRWRRRDLERFAGLIRETIAYQEGRLGKPYTAGGGVICVS